MAQEQNLSELRPFRVASLMAVEAAAKALAQRDRIGNESLHGRISSSVSAGGGGGGALSMFSPQSRRSASPHNGNSPRSDKSPHASALPSGQRSVSRLLLVSPLVFLSVLNNKYPRYLLFRYPLMPYANNHPWLDRVHATPTHLIMNYWFTPLLTDPP